MSKNNPFSRDSRSGMHGHIVGEDYKILLNINIPLDSTGLKLGPSLAAVAQLFLLTHAPTTYCKSRSMTATPFGEILRSKVVSSTMLGRRGNGNETNLNVAIGSFTDTRHQR